MMHDEPKYDLRYELDPQLVAAVLSLVGDGERLRAVKLLVERTGCGIAAASFWIANRNPGEPTPCPYCGQSLATRQARQCLSCGMDWHNPDNVVRRGDPQWNRFGLKPDEVYVVELCQGANQHRYTKYREVTSGKPDLEAAFETEPARGWQFIAWGEQEYARYLRLASGELFCFDPFGNWLIEREVSYLKRRDAGELKPGEQPPIINGASPWWRK